MAVVTLRLTSATVAAQLRRRSPKLAGLIVAAMALIGLHGTVNFAAGPLVMERPTSNSFQDVAAKAKRKSADAAGKDGVNITAWQSGGQPTHAAKPTSLGPPWTTCFAESEVGGRPVLEEWVMRGDGNNVQAFTSWRKQGGESGTEDGPTSVRCTPAAAVDEEALCIECVSHSGYLPSSGSGGGAAVAVARAQVVDTFVGLKQCLAHSVGGSAFCKSGQVVVPR